MTTARDNTVEVAKNLGINYIIEHEENKGYGGNQKSCYDKALEINSDIVVMLHPDYQYTPKLIHSMCYLIANDVYQVVLGSRILGKGALKGGMPLYKYVANRFLTLAQNMLMKQKLSEYHTGYRAFSREVLLKAKVPAQLRRFHLRQPDAGPDLLRRLRDRRDHLPDKIFRRGLLQSASGEASLTASA
ncbi:MAG: glycosyltransferase family 2 protein [Ignavibacteriales bacterium]|nr:glycosyltransferase family 2 protein [Ignavibacteriales bacterium]